MHTCGRPRSAAAVAHIRFRGMVTACAISPQTNSLHLDAACSVACLPLQLLPQVSILPLKDQHFEVALVELLLQPHHSALQLLQACSLFSSISLSQGCLGSGFYKVQEERGLTFGPVHTRLRFRPKTAANNDGQASRHNLQDTPAASYGPERAHLKLFYLLLSM